ncbi:hypothetical protein DL96DRAFT_413081 [Flagelloscypha sp. PMI_526]|nr:hypothetical protein DL96DRAFT_413081 [Flagelloscypha sp. PMI_526]
MNSAALWLFFIILHSESTPSLITFAIDWILLSYDEAAFPFLFFAHETTRKLSTLTLTSFFQNQTFPHNWHRRPISASFSSDIRPLSLSILSVHPTVRPGVSSPNGTYILDQRIQQSRVRCIMLWGEITFPAWFWAAEMKIWKGTQELWLEL